MEPRRRVLAPSLERWLAAAPGDGTAAPGHLTGRPGDVAGGDQERGGRRAVVVRLPAAADPDRAAERLRAAGASVQTPGRASIGAIVGPAELRRLLDEPWIVAIEEPRRLFPAGPPDTPGV